MLQSQMKQAREGFHMRYIDAGEAHGPGLVAIVDDVPAGLRINLDSIDADVARWDRLHGRPSPGRAHKRVELLSGVRDGRTTGSPVVFWLARADFSAAVSEVSRCTVPRPGTAELSAALKFDFDDCSCAAERINPQTDAARVAAAGVAREFLADLGIEIHSYVTRVGSALMREEDSALTSFAYKPLDIEMSQIRCPSDQATRAMEAQIDEALTKGETLGGALCVAITGLDAGLGGYIGSQNPISLRAALAGAAFSVEGICGVEFGCGSVWDNPRGSRFADTPECGKLGFSRVTNHAGGIEGGLSTGAPVLMRVVAEPPPTSNWEVVALDMETLERVACPAGHYDACRVPSAAVALESAVAFVLARAYRRKFGGDSMGDVHASLAAYRERLARAAR